MEVDVVEDKLVEEVVNELLVRVEDVLEEVLKWAKDVLDETLAGVEEVDNKVLVRVEDVLDKILVGVKDVLDGILVGVKDVPDGILEEVEVDPEIEIVEGFVVLLDTDVLVPATTKGVAVKTGVLVLEAEAAVMLLVEDIVELVLSVDNAAFEVVEVVSCSLIAVPLLTVLVSKELLEVVASE